MAEGRDIRVVAEVKRVGNSLAIFIPAEKAREAGLKEGASIEAAIHEVAPDPFGLLAHLDLSPFDRKKEAGRRDRE